VPHYSVIIMRAGTGPLYINAAGCHYPAMTEPRTTRRRAVERLLAAVRTLGPELLPPRQAAGRVAARDGTTGADVPGKPCSLRDGFAVRTEDTAGATQQAPVRLIVTRTVRADSPHGGILDPGDAARVLTGGPLPEEADAVLPEEDVTQDGETILVPEPAKPGWFVRPIGGEIARNSTVLRAGTRISPQAAGVLMRASSGSLAVHPVPRARVLALGSELADPDDGKPTQSGRFPADNLVLVEGFLRRCGVNVVAKGVLPDYLDMVAGALSGDLPDLVITSGGTGRSERDFAHQAAEQAGFTLLFNGVDMRPGRNVFGAVRDRTLLLGLPGPPAAVFACLHAIALPLVRRLSGLADPHEPTTARLTQGFGVRQGCEWIVPCTLGRKGSTLTATPLMDRDIPPLLAVGQAHGAAILQGGRTLHAGDDIELAVAGLE